MRSSCDAPYPKAPWSLLGTMLRVPGACNTKDIAIITPYRAQQCEIRGRLHRDLGQGRGVPQNLAGGGRGVLGFWRVALDRS